MPNVTLTGVGRRFGALKAVDAVDLAVENGEFVTLLGPSGCGKTTTLRMVAGLERNDTGSIAIGGRVVSDAAAGLFQSQREIEQTKAQTTVILGHRGREPAGVDHRAPCVCVELIPGVTQRAH